MNKEEFEEIFKYITALALREVKEETKEDYWECLKVHSFENVMRKAKEVYRLFEGPCEMGLLNPKIYSGEHPNPGLFFNDHCEVIN